MPMSYDNPMPGGGDTEYLKRHQLLYVDIKTGMPAGRRAAGEWGAQGQRPGTLIDKLHVKVRRGHQILATQLAERAAMILERQIRRRQTGSGRLAQAILDPVNRYATVDGYGVGKVANLDRSQAKYWRAIERGSSYFIGRPLVGVWSENRRGGPFHGMDSSRKQDRFVPLNRRLAMRLLTRQQARGGPGPSRPGLRVSTYGIITRPIPAYRYFEKAWNEMHEPERAQQALIAALREVGLIV